MLNNADFKFDTLNIGRKNCNILLPTGHNQCWTISQTIAIGPTLREEISRENMGLLGILYRAATYIFEHFGKIMKIDNAVFPYCYGFSTNLYNEGEIANLLENKNLLQEKYRNSAIILRSLNEKCFDLKSLHKYKYLPTRVVWYCDDLQAEVLSRKDTKSDNKAFAKSGLSWNEYDIDASKDKLPRIIELYKILYIDKYSKHNPDFSQEYLFYLISQGVLKLRCLETQNGEIVGFLAYFSTNNAISAPLIGYDADYKSAPIYRIIMSEAANIAHRSKKALNHSGGAAKYKTNRGFTPLVEYMLIIDSHLPWWRRFGYTIISYVFRKFEKQLLETVTK